VKIAVVKIAAEKFPELKIGTGKCEGRVFPTNRKYIYAPAPVRGASYRGSWPMQPYPATPSRGHDPLLD
jgi:hypothetical protein